MTTLIATAILAGVGQANPTVNDIVVQNFRDATFTIRVQTGNQRELAKINRDFAASYRFRWTRVSMKEPFRLRLESTVDDTDILFILNGPIQQYRIPKAGLSQRTDLSRAPGRRQTSLDFGFLTPALFSDLYDAQFVRIDRRSGDFVFDLTYKPALGDRTRQRVFVDPQRRIINRREWYNQQGAQMATFFYENPRQFGGIWFPTRMVVRNVEDQVAGVSTYEEIRINPGLPDSLFDVR